MDQITLTIDGKTVTARPDQTILDVIRENRIAEIDAEVAKRRALRKHLVEHIAWFQERQERASSKPRFPRAPSHGSTTRNAGQAGGKKT